MKNEKWPLKKLEDLTELERPITYGVVKPGPEDPETGVRFIRGGDIFEGKIAIEDLRTISTDVSNAYSRTLLQGGELIISLVGNPGHVAIVPQSLKGANLARQAGLIALRSDVNTKYVMYYLMSSQGRAELFSQMTGSVQVVINLLNLRNVRIPIPHQEIQNRIASILSSYDDLIENNQRRIKILEEMARSLYREWFVHFRYPGHEKERRVKSSLGATSDSLGAGIPEGWEVTMFDDLLVSMTGGDWGADQPNENESLEVAIIRGTDFEEVTTGGHIRAPIRYIKPSSYKTRGLRVGDVIVENSINAKSRCIGTTLLVDSYILSRIEHDSVAASFCKVFRLKDPKLAPLVHLHFRRLREDARMEYYQNVAANGIGNFQAQKFAKEEYLVLPKDEMLRTKLIDGIQSVFDKISVLSSQISNLRMTRDLLLPRLMSGQVSLKD